ncbi:MAG: 2-phosphosulfolactate phosphatase [Cyclobacteriaceae bacterium]
MRKIEVCLSPELIHQHELEGKIVVVVDIFRATSCIVSGLAHGVAAIKPVASVDETFELGNQGYLMAGERGGEKVEGFDIGNSPFEYMDDDLIGRKVAISTTNGTQAIAKSMEADQILVGAFLNLSATADFLTNQDKDVVIHCAGWKGTVNIEDSLYAGALVQKLDAHTTANDSALVASELYRANQNDLYAAGKRSGHAHRLAGFGVTKDIEFCMKVDEMQVVVGLEGEHLVRI